MSDISKKTRVVVLMGGLSSERKVSLDSGKQVHQALVGIGYNAHAVDWTAASDLAQLLRDASAEVVWNALHGTFGEDGCVQGLLECLRIPYTGSGPASSAVAMDKVLSKRTFAVAKLDTPDWCVVSDGDDALALAKTLGFPLVVKPALEGSTVGITICKDETNFADALALAGSCHGSTLLEKYIPGAELSVAILDGKALSTVEIRPRGETYDYEAKYESDDTEYLVPAPVPEAAREALHQASETAYHVLGCSGHARADFRLPPGGTPWLLEVNTLPGMTSHSLMPKMAADFGIDFPTLCEKILLGARLHIWRGCRE